MSKKWKVGLGVLAVLVMLGLPLAYVMFAPPTGMRIEGAQVLGQAEGRIGVATLYLFQGTIDEARDHVRAVMGSNPAWEERDYLVMGGKKIDYDPYWVLKSDNHMTFMIYREAVATVQGRRYPGIIGMKTEPTNVPPFLSQLRSYFRPTLEVLVKR